MPTTGIHSTEGNADSCIADFNKLAALPDNSPLLADQIKQAQARLPKKIEKQQEKEKEEVVGKLKDLGNMVLGASAASLVCMASGAAG